MTTAHTCDFALCMTASLPASAVPGARPKNFNELPPVRRGNRAAPLPHVRHRNPHAGIDARPRPPLRIAYK
jgi:hypothetical protein